MTFGQDGGLYVVCQTTGSVVQLDPSTGGVIRVVVSGFVAPNGLTTDPVSGALFVSDCNTHEIYRIDPATGTTTPYTAPGALACSDGMVFDAMGVLYVSDHGNGHILRVDRTGASTVLTTLPGAPDGIALGAPGSPIAGSLFVNRNDGVISRVDLTQSPPAVTDFATGGSRGDFILALPDGSLLADQSDRVVKITPGEFQPTPGGSGPAPPASVNGGPVAAANSPHSKEPVNLATGNYANQRTDVSIPGKGLPLVFAGSYNSVAIANGRFGYGWQDNLNARLLFDNADHSIANITVVQEQGRQDQYARQNDGSYLPPAGIFDVLTRNSLDGSFTLRRKDRSTLHFDPNGVLLSLADRNGNTTALAYSAGKLTTATDPSGRTLTFAYDGANRITSVTDPLGRITHYSYDGSGNLASATDPAGGVTSYTYDTNHRMLTITDPRGHVIMTNVYDGQGRVTSQTNALGKTWTFTYGPGQTTETDQRGCATVHAYDQLYRETQRTDCLSGVATYTYDSFGNRNSVTDPLGHTTRMTYDARGNRLSVTDALSHTTTFTYDSQDDLLSKTDALSHTTSYTYDSHGNLLSATNALGGVSSFIYDGQGELLTSTDPRGNSSSFTYNSNGYQVSATDPLGHTASFSYDAGGRLLSQTDPLGRTNTFTYDNLDRLLTTTDPLSHVRTNVYDADGNKTSVTDANGKTTSYVYDALNRLTSATDAAGGVVSYAYDALGNRISMTDANGHTTAYAYDLLGRLTSVTDPLGRVTSYTYDAAGNRISRTDARTPTRTTHYSYDAINRLTAITYPTGGVTYSYDALGNRTQMIDGTGATSYVYDSLSRLISITDPQGRTASYGYDVAGNRISLTYPDGHVVTYVYDAANRMSSVTDWNGHTTSYTYDNATDLLSTALPNGITSSQSYDGASRLIQVTNGAISSFTYALDPVGNRTSMTTAAGSESYTYDSLYRLRGVAYANGDTQSYTYDAMGNRLTKTQNGSPTTYSYDAADQLIQAGGVPQVYDGNGALVLQGPSTDPSNTNNTFYLQDYEQRYLRIGHCYDQFIGNPAAPDGQMTAADILAIVRAYGHNEGTPSYDPRTDISPPGQPDGYVSAADILAVVKQYGETCPDTGHFLYNGDGLRVQTWVPPGPSQPPARTDYVWDVAASLPVILEQISGGVTTDYVYGLGLVASVQGSNSAYYLGDGLGSTTELTDGSGAVTATYRYDVFGALRSSTGTSSQPFRFTGQQQDAAVNGQPYYLRARYYDPTSARFLSVDSARGITGQPYIYGAQNPVNRTDLTGLFAIPWLLPPVDVLGSATAAWNCVTSAACIGQTATTVSTGLSVVRNACLIGAGITLVTGVGGAFFGTCVVVTGGLSLAALGVAGLADIAQGKQIQPVPLLIRALESIGGQFAGTVVRQAGGTALDQWVAQTAIGGAFTAGGYLLPTNRTTTTGGVAQQSTRSLLTPSYLTAGTICQGSTSVTAFK